MRVARGVPDAAAPERPEHPERWCEHAWGGQQRQLRPPRGISNGI